MKISDDFITNSSSTSFMITNKTDKDLTLVDFVKENPQLIDEFLEEYSLCSKYPEYTNKQLLEDAKNRKEIFPANDTKYSSYGDQDGDVLGYVFDYMLRDGGNSESFKWKFYEYLR